MKRRILIVDTLILVSVFAAAQSPSADKAAPQSSAASGSIVPQRVHISREVAQHLLIKTVPPKYPKDARRARIQDMVNLKALIDKDGNVADVIPISGEKALAPAAMEAVKQWTYKPYVVNGQAVAAEFEVSINFSLAGN